MINERLLRNKEELQGEVATIALQWAAEWTTLEHYQDAYFVEDVDVPKEFVDKVGDEYGESESESSEGDGGVSETSTDESDDGENDNDDQSRRAGDDKRIPVVMKNDPVDSMALIPALTSVQGPVKREQRGQVYQGSISTQQVQIKPEPQPRVLHPGPARPGQNSPMHIGSAFPVQVNPGQGYAGGIQVFRDYPVEAYCGPVQAVQGMQYNWQPNLSIPPWNG